MSREFEGDLAKISVRAIFAGGRNIERFLCITENAVLSEFKFLISACLSDLDELLEIYKTSVERMEEEIKEEFSKLAPLRDIHADRLRRSIYNNLLSDARSKLSNFSIIAKDFASYVFAFSELRGNIMRPLIGDDIIKHVANLIGSELDEEDLDDLKIKIKFYLNKEYKDIFLEPKMSNHLKVSLFDELPLSNIDYVDPSIRSARNREVWDSFENDDSI